MSRLDFAGLDPDPMGIGAILTQRASYNIYRDNARVAFMAIMEPGTLIGARGRKTVGSPTSVKLIEPLGETVPGDGFATRRACTISLSMMPGGLVLARMVDNEARSKDLLAINRAMLTGG